MINQSLSSTFDMIKCSKKLNWTISIEIETSCCIAIFDIWNMTNALTSNHDCYFAIKKLIFPINLPDSHMKYSCPRILIPAIFYRSSDSQNIAEPNSCTGNLGWHAKRGTLTLLCSIDILCTCLYFNSEGYLIHTW